MRNREFRLEGSLKGRAEMIDIKKGGRGLLHLKSN